MSWLARLALALGIAAAVALLASGPGHRFGIFDYQVGIGLLRASAYIGLAAGALSLVALCVPRLRAGRARMLSVALVVGLAAAAPPLEFRRQAGLVPPINDISTDFANATFAEQQRRAYPDIAPLEMKDAPPAAFARAMAAGEAMGWQIATRNPAAGHFSAVAKTAWFGFQDDIDVRVTPLGSGSRLDIRSRSRVGRSDIGANARRIRAYFERLK